MVDEGHVLVIGSSGIDIKGRPPGPLTYGTPNLGRVRNSVGGVARNIAENLARLEVPTVLLSAIGRDAEGGRVMRASEKAGIDMESVLRIPGKRTGSYMALLTPEGQLDVAIADFEITEAIDSDYILDHEYLFEDALMVAIDATLEDDALETVIDTAARYDVKIAADPTNPMLAGRLCRFLDALEIIVPNASETQSLCGLSAVHDRDSALDVARTLVSMGVEVAVVTLGAEGLVYAHSGGAGALRALQTEVIDATGAGDAFCAGMIFGMLNHVPLDEAMRLGSTAASLTLRSRNTVLTDISQDLLYEELMA